MKVLLHMTFDMTGSLFIPFWVDQYATVLREWVEDLSDIHNYTLKSHNITLGTWMVENMGLGSQGLGKSRSLITLVLYGAIHL